MGGDFNFPLSKTDKERGSDVSSRKDVASEMEQLKCIKLDLDDVWIALHPDEKHFTLRTSDLKKIYIYSLDYWLLARQKVSNGLNP